MAEGEGKGEGGGREGGREEERRGGEKRRVGREEFVKEEGFKGAISLAPCMHLV